MHGSLATDTPAQRDEITARLPVCHGALDPHVPREQLDGFIEEMNASRADWQLNVYGQAMHGFTHDAGPDQLAAQMRRQLRCRAAHARHP